MSKLFCPCGAVISDNTDNLPYKGWLIADSDIHQLVGSAGKKIFSELSKNSLNEEDIGDLIFSILCDYSRDIYQCLECGLVHIEKQPNKNTFARFVPEQAEHKDWLVIKE